MDTHVSAERTERGAAPAPDGLDPVVSLRQVTKTYEPTTGFLNFLVRSSITEPVHALRGVDLDLSAGQLKAIVGPNGAGKTTLFRILVGLTTASSGDARVLGLDAVRDAERTRRRIGFMPSDDRSLFMRLSCAENLRFHGRIHGLKGEVLQTAIRDSLERVGLGHRSTSAVFSLSAGMRARLQLARATLHDPSLLILDEPTATIDPVASHELLSLLLELVETQGIGALISSHRLEEIEALSTDVLLLDRGLVRFDGDLESLRRIDQPLIELVFSSPEAASEAMIRLDGLADLDLIESMIECHPRDGRGAGGVLAALGPVLSDLLHCRERPLPLRDLLAQMYRTEDVDQGSTS